MYPQGYMYLQEYMYPWGYMYLVAADRAILLRSALRIARSYAIAILGSRIAFGTAILLRSYCDPTFVCCDRRSPVTFSFQARRPTGRYHFLGVSPASSQTSSQISSQTSSQTSSQASSHVLETVTCKLPIHRPIATTPSGQIGLHNMK